MLNIDKNSIRESIKLLLLNSSTLLEALAFVAVFSAATLAGISGIILKGGYDVSYGVLIRFVVFLFALCLAGLYVPLKRMGIFPLSPSVLVTAGASLIFIFVSVACFIWWVHTTFYTWIMLMVSAYIGIYLAKIIAKIQQSEKGGGVKKWVIALLVLLAILMPILTKKYINSESYVDVDYVPIVLNSYKKNIENVAEEFELPLNEKILDNLHLNFEKLRLGRMRHAVGYYELNEHDQYPLAKFFLNRADMSALCLLGDYDGYEGRSGYDNINSCISNVKSSSNSRRERLISALGNIPISDVEIKKKIYQKIYENNLNNSTIGNCCDVQSLIKIMMVKGAYFHHYNSIAYTINDNQDLLGYAANQYGLGPLLVVKGIQILLSTTVFDSIYLSIILGNVFVFIVLLFTLKDTSNRSVVWMGFAMSVLVTYCVSNVLAPFVYFIRYLPSVMLGVLLFKANDAKVILKNNAVYRILFFSILLLVAFYNFEYALLTCAAIAAAGFMLRSSFYIKTGIVFFVISLVPKILAPAASLGGNYLAYLGGVGFDGRLGYLTYLFFLAAAIILGLSFKAVKENAMKEEAVVLVVLTAALCVKVVWMGAINHVGPLFLLFAMIMHFLLTRAYPNKQDQLFGIASNVVSVINVLILLGAFVSWAFFYQNNKLIDLKYVHSSISSLFKISQGLANKVEDFNTLYRPGDLALSPIDNVLSLRVSSSLTLPYPDISTNINYPIDILKVTSKYLQEDSRRVIVDRDVINVLKNKHTYYLLVRGDDVLLEFFHDYVDNLEKMQSIYNQLIKNGAFVCGGSNYFVILCR